MQEKTSVRGKKKPTAITPKKAPRGPRKVDPSYQSPPILQCQTESVCATKASVAAPIPTQDIPSTCIPIDVCARLNTVDTTVRVSPIYSSRLFLFFVDVVLGRNISQHHHPTWPWPKKMHPTASSPDLDLSLLMKTPTSTNR